MKKANLPTERNTRIQIPVDFSTVQPCFHSTLSARCRTNIKVPDIFTILADPNSAYSRSHLPFAIPHDASPKHREIPRWIIRVKWVSLFFLFVRYAGGSLPTLPRDLGNRFLDIVKLDDYQEPYQALKYAPYYSYSTVVMEMKDMMLNNKGSNINHSGMPCSVHGRPALFCVHTYIRTRTTRVHTRISTVYLYAGARWSLCWLRATAATRTYVPNNKAFAWPQSIHCPPVLSSPYPPPVPHPFLLCYIIRSGVREWCSWHIVRLCGTGTRHGAPAQPGQHRTRACRFQRHQRPGQHLLQDLFAWQQDRKQKGTNRLYFDTSCNEQQFDSSAVA